jgi:uncharacterized membrane protein required for colicin V production
MNSWNGLDFFIFLILVLNTIQGMSRGASREITSMLCLSAALIFAIKFTIPLSNFFNASPAMNDFVTSSVVQNFMTMLGANALTPDLITQIMYSISLLICFVGIFSVCEAGLSFAKMADAIPFPYAALNRKIGAGIGFTRGYIIVLMFLSILIAHLNAVSSVGANFISGSFFARTFESQANLFDSLISSQQPENYNQLYKNKPYNEKDLIQNLKSGQ